VRTALTLGLPYNSGTDKGILCQLHAPNPGSTTGREVSLFNSLANSEPRNNQFMWATATPYRLTMIRGAGGRYACSATDAGGTEGSATGSESQLPMQQEVAVVASGTSARVAWVLVVSSL
jgi:hypothetical protein